MEELNIIDVLAGLQSIDYKEHHLALLQHLSNLVCEELDCVGVQNVVRHMLARLSILTKQEGNEAEIDLSLLVLSNLTALETNSGTFLEEVRVGQQNEVFSLLNSKFLDYDCTIESADPTIWEDEYWALVDPFRYFASLLCNISRLEEGRHDLLRKSNGRMERLFLQFKSHNDTRRLGSVNSLRNCLFDSDIHFWMLHEMKVLSAILPPLIVGTVPFTEREKKGMDPLLWLLAEDPDKKPDPNVDVIKALISCVVLLCQNRGIRQELRVRRVYYICRNVDTFLEDESVNDICYEVVNFLERDDDPYEAQEEAKMLKN